MARRFAVVVVAIVALSALPSTAALLQGGESSGPILLEESAGTLGPVGFVVTYDPAITSGGELAEIVTGAGGLSRVWSQFPVLGAFGDRGVIEAVAASPGVLAIEPDAPIDFYLNAGPHTIGADAVRAPESEGGFGVDGAGVSVGLIDTGADGTHHDLQGRLKRNVKVAFTWLTCDGDPFRGPPEEDGPTDFPCEGQPFPAPIDMSGRNADTSSGHGSHVAGIIAGEGTASGGVYTGVAPGANLVSVGVGDYASITWALDGFEFLLRHAEEDNLVAINNSWGEVKTDEQDTSSPSATNAIRKVVEVALSRGISVIFAAGNDGCPGNYSTINTYALINGVISVASTLREGTAVSDFSSCGRTSDTKHDPTLAAPGSDITSVRGGPALLMDPLLFSTGAKYISGSGTSMATPHVSGVVALIQSARIAAGKSKLSASQIRTILIDTADPLAVVATRHQGAGLVDAAAAVTRALELPDSERPPALSVCPIVNDPTEDATAALYNTPTESVPSLDIVSGSLATSGSELVGTIKVADLTLDDLRSGAGLYFEFLLTSYGGTEYYVSGAYTKAYPKVGATTVFRIGYFPVYAKVGGTSVGGISYFGPTRTTLATGAGTFDLSSDTITIRVPLSGTNYDLSGLTLHNVQVVSRRDLVRVIPDADIAWGRQAYTVGSVC